MTTLDDILVHYGVKGMKWGVKKGVGKPSHPDSADHTSAQAVKTKGKQGGTKALSNKEIQDYLARLNLERQFKQTTPSGKAGAFISKLLIGAGTQQAQTATNTAAAKIVAGGLSRARRP